MAYIKQQWNNNPPSDTTPISAARLNHLETQYDEAMADILDTTVQSVVAGENISVDNTDPLNPVISTAGAGAGEWGSIGGDINDQADLRDELDSKTNKEGAVDAAISVEIGGRHGNALFDRLWQGVADITADTRVIGLGSSTANAGMGGYVTEPEKAAFWRLAYRAGAPSYPRLLEVTAPVTGSGMRWWNGASGNQTSANYLPPDRRTQLNNVKPHYVLHMIGSNDMYYGISIQDYKANLRDALEFIESASPGVVNILIHQPDRMDEFTPVASWQEYGTAMGEVAAENPGSRVFLDTTQYFAHLGAGTDNRGGIMYDDVHVNDLGHRYLADIIGMRMGIPSETNYNPMSNIVRMPLPATAPYDGSQLAVGQITIPASKFPREAILTGALWVTHAGSSNAFIVARHLSNVGAINSSYSHRIVNGGASSVMLNSTHYIAPGPRTTLQIRISTGGSSITVQGEPTLAHASVELRPV